MAEDIATEVEEVESEVVELSAETSTEVDVVSEAVGTNLNEMTFNVSEDISEATFSAAQSESSAMLSEGGSLNDSITEIGEDAVANLSDQGLDGAEVSDRLSSSLAEQQAARSPSVGEGGKSSTLARVGKGLLLAGNIYIMVDFFGKQIFGLFQIILDTTKNPEWKMQLTDDDRKTLTAVQTALTTMKTLTSSWDEQWKKLEQDPVGLGTVPVKFGGKTRDVPVIDVVYFTLQDMGAVSLSIDNILRSSVLSMVSVNRVANLFSHTIKQTLRYLTDITQPFSRGSK